jgi:heptaprenyl diphosphate synthase
LTPRPGSFDAAGGRWGRNRIPGNYRALAILGGFCLFLSTLEYLIPKPLPFMRIGLANLPLLLALDLFPPGSFALLVLIKVSGQALITGTLFSYVFLCSLAGSSVSAFAMYSLCRLLGKNRISFTGIGITGAVLSNLVQLFLARFFIFGAGVRFLAPVFLGSGLLTGCVLGLFCEAFAARSRWYGRALGRNGAEGLSGRPRPADKAADAASGGAAGGPARKGETRRLRRQEQWNRLFRGEDLFITGFFIMLIFLFTSSLAGKALQFLFFWLLLWLSGKKNRPHITLLLMAGIVFCSLLAPYGKILAEIGPLKISQGALLAGLRRALTLEGMVMISGTFVRAGIRLPGVPGALLGESFRLFALLRERKRTIDRKHFIEEIDELMLELDQDIKEAPEYEPGGKAGTGFGEAGPGRRHPASLPLLAAMTLASVLFALGPWLKWAEKLLPRPGPG